MVEFGRELVKWGGPTYRVSSISETYVLRTHYCSVCPVLHVQVEI